VLRIDARWGGLEIARPLSAAQVDEGLSLRTSPIAEMSTPADGSASPISGLAIDKK